MTFVDRVLQLIEEKNISKNKLLTDLELSKNSFVNWLDRGNTPSGDVIVKIAKYFNVSVDYLLGLSDERHRLISFEEIDTISPSYDEELFALNVSISGSESDPELKTLREFMDSHSIQYEVSTIKKKAVPKEQPPSNDELEYLRLIKTLTDDERQKLIDYAELLKRGRTQ